jgi:hypothetical protein
VDDDCEVINIGKLPEEIDLYSEIPLHAQLRAIIEGHLRFYNGADVSLELTALAGGAQPSTGESTADPTIGSPGNHLALPGNDQRGTSLFSHGH